MNRARQSDFFEKNKEYGPRRHTHGGAAANGRRKVIRPIDRKRPLHLVLKASVAKEKLSMLGPKRLKIEQILRAQSKKFGVKIHGFENVGNHLHILASFTKRQTFQNFLRTLAALIARLVTGARKGKPFGRKFWDHLAFTRVVTGRRDYRGLVNYFEKNAIEREVGGLARQVVEEYEEAERKAKRRGCNVWEILEAGARPVSFSNHPHNQKQKL